MHEKKLDVYTLNIDIFTLYSKKTLKK